MSDARAALEFDDDHPGRIEKLDLTAMRRLNAIRILDTVRRHGPISRASLAKHSRLSPPAVSALVDELLVTHGWLREVGQDVSTGGRRPTLLSFDASRGCVIGVDLGSTTIRYAVADLNGGVLGRAAEPIRDPSPAGVVTRLTAAVQRLHHATPGQPPLYAVGIGAPGMTDVTRGVVIEAANLKGWTQVPLQALVARALNAPVALENDVNMAAMGEYWMGCARGESNFVFVALGRGVGAGIMIDGRLHRGSQWYAGEISHLLLDVDRWRSNFGAQGYLEHHIGAAAIAREWRRLARQGRGADVGPTALFAAARDGHAGARRLLRDLATMLGVAIANVVTTLDPALVVVGGGVGQAGEQLLGPVRDVVARIVPNQPVIRMTALGGDAQLFGSVLTALRLAHRSVRETILGGGSSRPAPRQGGIRSRQPRVPR